MQEFLLALRCGPNSSTFSLLCIFLTNVSASDSFIKTIISCKGLAIPIYENTSSHPVAIIFINHVEKDHERRGFFKIGALPIFNAMDVNICVYGNIDHGSDYKHIKPALQWLSKSAPLNIHSFVVSIGKRNKVILRSSHASILKEGRIRLYGDVSLSHNSHIYQGVNGYLYTSTGKTGNLMVELDGNDLNLSIGNSTNQNR